MKKILSVAAVLLLLFVQNISAQGWQWVDTGFPVHIFEMSFPPGQSDVGFAVGSTLPFGGDGIILKTTNSGSTWSKISADTIPGLKAVCFTSLNVGFAAGYQNFLMKTTDGGTNWTFQMIDDKLWYFNSLEFWDANTGVIVSYPSSVYRTTDAGTTWEPTFGLKHTVEDICYADETNLFLVGSDEKIYKSTNSGFFWNEVYTGTALKDFYGLEFLNADYGMVCGDSGKVLVTTDGGVNWNLNAVSSLGLLNDIHIVNEQNSFVIGSPELVYKTTNGGSSWLSDFSGGNVTSFYKILFTEDQVGLISGSEGKFLKNVDYAVPVELTSFTAIADSNEVHISWTTQTELNNSGFEIYRLTHGTDWQKITFVPGSGSSTEPKEYFYIDRDVKNGNYFYQLKQIDYNGRYEFSDVISVEVSTPVEYSLEQNYPNPFNPTTTIRFSIPSVIASGAKQSPLVTLKVYDVLGNEVALLVNEEKPEGLYEVEFSARDLPSGIYLCELRAEKYIAMKKMILIK
ncbi:MAG: T9SS type A sorting domain-containing protein [Ignavibacteriaceae bacterium]|nr:T9SS type A sorting domain-containing protein [Ignavibacteriaceae bacterium]